MGDGSSRSASTPLSPYPESVNGTATQHVRRGDASPTAAAAHSHTLLLVEDDDDTREALTMLLRSLGVCVTSARSGRDALAVLRDGCTPCLLLLDVRMPDMGATAFRAEQLADAKLARIPVVLTSGDSELPNLAATLGVAGYVGKPLEPKKLLDIIGRYCGGH